MTKLWKILGVIAIVAALGAVVAMPALADGPDTTVPMWERVRQWFGGNDANGAGTFIDEDGDGVCDVCGGVPGEGIGYGNGNGYGSGDGSGLAPADGTGNAYGRGQMANGASQFVDEDGDGICDVCGEALGEALGYGNGYGSGDGTGLAPADGTGNAYGRGQGINGTSQFVDEDGDGVCDICGEACDGLGLGTGTMGGMMRGGRAR